MELYEVLKIMSSESKAKIIAKFYCCQKCQNNTVNEMCDQIKLKQGNMSKHLMELREKGVIINKKIGRYVHYEIDKDFMKRWGDLILKIIKYDNTLINFNCGCPKK